MKKGRAFPLATVLSLAFGRWLPSSDRADRDMMRELLVHLLGDAYPADVELDQLIKDKRLQNHVKWQLPTRLVSGQASIRGKEGSGKVQPWLDSWAKRYGEAFTIGPLPAANTAA